MRVALVGVGSLGTITGALMTKNGIDLTMVDANKEHVDALNKYGATITGKMDIKNIPVHACLPEEMEGIYDLIFLLTKQTVNHIILPKIMEHMDENSVLCTLQNGAPEDLVASYVGKERTIGGVVGWGATYLGPGVSELTSAPLRMVFEIGELDGSITPRVQKAAEILGKAGVVHVMDNLVGVKWSKLITNATMSGLSAALGVPYGGIVANDKALTIAAFQANELIKIANARGLKLEILYEGYDFYDIQFNDQAGLDHAKEWMRDYYKHDDKVIASMLRDMRNGIPCEIDQICGIVADWGDKLNIDTPYVDKCIKIVKEFERGERPLPTIDNLDEFETPTI